MNETAERALLARPLAIGLGALGVVWLNPLLRQDTMFLWLAVMFGGPNVLLWLTRRRAFVRRIAPVFSPTVSLLGWGTLATFTLGLKSPILAGFFFEIGLASVSLGPRGVAAVTAAAIAVLTLVQSLFGLASGWQLLLLEAAFLAVMGGLGLAMARRRVAGEAALRDQRQALGRRLEALQRQLDDERVVARVGENVARLAHGLKNAVHSLRGFVTLIEPEVERGGRSREALAGLRAVIDDLERLARMTLADAPGESTATSNSRSASALASASVEGSIAASATSGKAARRVRAEAAPVVASVEAVCRELGPSHPEVAFDLRATAAMRSLAVPIAPTPFREVLTILLRNAAEAMHGAGRCTIDVSRRADDCRIEIGDEGEGLAPDASGRLFTPGFTTKTGGSGFGLFLARRIAEDHGGSLSLESGPEKGAIAVLALPIAEQGAGVGASAAAEGASAGNGSGA
ncbi:MAG: sensor histidine kinase [Myxococcota bacterium]